ncbi:MAG: hypothetical protein CMO01_27785 [Thalassobius sp.]|nr:hypothetical protein [Thalassovita sp.]
MKFIRHFFTSFLLLCLVVIISIPLWKPFLFVNESLLPETISGLKQMKLVRAGNFAMGDHTEQNYYALPIKHVKLSSFYIDETPVTVNDFKEYIAAGGELPAYWSNELFQKTDFPVTGVSWNQAVDFCNWRSRVEGLEPVYELTEEKDKWGYFKWKLNKKKNGYRLPTEAEFEFAARGGLKESEYPWGNDFEKTFANYDNERGQPLGNWILLANVKSQKANNFGLYGMSGNIWQWCNDWYEDGYDEKSNKKNPLGPELGDVKVLRGGSWGSTTQEQLKVSYRSYAAIGNYNYDIGFRCVRPVQVGILKTLKNKELSLNANYEFYQTPKGEANPENDFYQTEEFHAKLRNYIADNYHNSIYLQEEIGKQKKLNPSEMADVIINTSRRYDINPVFTTAVMVAETGMGTVSLSRWFNNPVAFNWKMPAMDGRSVIFTANNVMGNKTYYGIEECLQDFYLNLRNPQVRNVANSDLFDFHKVWLGEEKFYWMQNISNVYRDLAGINIEEDFPANNVGKLIYLDWVVSDEYIEEIFPEKDGNFEMNTPEDKVAFEEEEVEQTDNSISETTNWPTVETQTEKVVAAKPVEKENDAAVRPKKAKKKVYYLIVKENLEMKEAAALAGNLRKNGFSGAGVLELNNKNAVALAHFEKLKEANSAKSSLSEIYGDIKMITLDE